MRRPPAKPTSLTVDEADRRAFEAAMADVRPLPSRPTPPEPAVRQVRSGPNTKTSAPPATLVRVEPPPGTDGAGDLFAHGYAFLAAGEPRTRLRQMRAGRPEHSLDLHGRTAAEADRALTAFIAQARQRGQRLLLVVHGRGLRSGSAGPVLRDRVIQSLSAGDTAAHVLALASAPPALGGPGAALVWLRRPAP